MNAALLIADTAGAGVNLHLDDDCLRWKASTPPSGHLLEKLKAAKVNIITHLNSTVGGSEVTPDIATGIAHLAAMSAPNGFPAERWRQFKADAILIEPLYAEAVTGAGWTATELSGLSRSAPWGCWRDFGLVPMLNDAEVTSIDAEKAMVRNRSGTQQRFAKRKPWRNAMPAWELAR